MAYYRYSRLQQYINGQPTDIYTTGPRVDDVDYNTYEDCMGGTTNTRWVSMPQTVCYNGDLWSMEKEQITYDDGATWNDTGNTRRAAVIEPSASQCSGADNDWRPVPNEYVCDGTSKCIKEAEYIDNSPTGRTRAGSIVELLSEDCGVMYQWVDVPNEYVCVYKCGRADKYTKQKQQYSIDGGEHWDDTGETREGDFIEKNSADCGCDTSITRWVTVSGEYVCVDTSKYTKEKEQTSTDAINWTDTGNTRAGSFIESESYDCGRVDYRWVTVSGQYSCVGYNKYNTEKEQQTSDGINWTDTGNTRAGSTLIEADSADCGYVPQAITQWVADTGYVCISTDKYNKEKEQVSYDGGNTWTDTGITRAGSTLIEASSSDCDSGIYLNLNMPVKQWLSENNIPYTSLYFAYDCQHIITDCQGNYHGETYYSVKHYEGMSTTDPTIYELSSYGGFNETTNPCHNTGNRCIEYNYWLEYLYIPSKYDIRRLIYDKGQNYAFTPKDHFEILTKSSNSWTYNNIQQGWRRFYTGNYSWCDGGTPDETIVPIESRTTRWVVDTDYICVGFDKYNLEKEQISFDNGNTWTDTGNTRTGSLVEVSSSSCASTRWVTVSGQYSCVGFDKYNLEKEQTSTDGINWTDTGNTRTGSTLIEHNSDDCLSMKYEKNVDSLGMKVSTTPCEDVSLWPADDYYTTDNVFRKIVNYESNGIRYNIYTYDSKSSESQIIRYNNPENDDCFKVTVYSIYGSHASIKRTIRKELIGKVCVADNNDVLFVNSYGAVGNKENLKANFESEPQMDIYNYQEAHFYNFSKDIDIKLEPTNDSLWRVVATSGHTFDLYQREKVSSDNFIYQFTIDSTDMRVYIKS